MVRCGLGYGGSMRLPGQLARPFICACIIDKSHRRIKILSVSRWQRIGSSYKPMASAVAKVSLRELSFGVKSLPEILPFPR